MVCGDPVSVISCRGGDSSCRIGGRINRLRLLGATSLLITALALALLREVRRDPNAVDEIGNTSEKGQNKEVEEDAIT